MNHCRQPVSNLQVTNKQPMSDEYQIEIPQSFMALYVDAGRYELCEDLATLLTETAKNMFFSLGITEQDVLERCHRGLTGEGAVVNPAEAQWVIHRLAELVGWPWRGSN
jgi:hypothetical protein